MSEDINSALARLEEIAEQVQNELAVYAKQIVTVDGLSDIVNALGLISTGEFRAGVGDPGRGFYGMRMVFPAATYGGTGYNLVGINNDVLQFGVRASDGKLLAGAGSVVLDSSGITAIGGSIGGWTIGVSSLYKSGIILDSSNDTIYIGSSTPRWVLDGANKQIKTSDFVSGSKGMMLNGATGSAEFNNVILRGALRASVMEYGQVQGVAGSQAITPSAGKLKSDVTTVAAPTTFNVDIEDPSYGHVQLFTAGDILRIKDGTSDSWVTVSSVSDQTTYYRYVCTLSNGTEGTYQAGSTVLSYGQSGAGFLFLSADATNAPFYSVRTHAGSPWDTITELIRIGNMNGFFDYSTDVFGLGVGSGASYMMYDTTNGLRLKADIVVETLAPYAFDSYLETPTGAINGSNKTFVPSNSLYINGDIPYAVVLHNGVYLYGDQGSADADFTTTSVNGITVSPAPSTGDKLLVSYLKAGTKSEVYDEVPTGDIDGVNTTYTTAYEIAEGTLLATLNGQVLDPNTEVSTGSGGITLVTGYAAPVSGDVILMSYQTSADESWTYYEIPGGAFDGVNTVFTLDHTPVEITLSVILNGLKLSPTDDYTLSGDEITMVEAPLATDLMWCMYSFA